MKTQTKIFYTSVLFLIYIFSLSNTVLSQPVTEWVQRYNSPGNYDDDLIDMVIDKEGNTYITGNTGNPLNIVTLKYSSSGNLLWSRTYNGPANRDDEAVKIAVDDSGFVYVAGKTFNPQEFTNYLLIKYSTNGDLIWQREISNGDSTTDVPRDMILDDYSNVYIIGSGYQCFLNCFGDYMTVKYDRNGNLKWKRFYHGEGYFSNYGWTLALDNFGRVIVSGKSADINNTYYNATVVYDANGSFIRKINIDSAEVRRLETDQSNNLYIGGFKKSPELPVNSDIFLNKYDSTGHLLWNKFYGSNNTSQNRSDYLSWMHLDAQELNMYLIGYGDINNQIGWDYILIKSNISNGDSLWKKGYVPVNNSDNYAVQLAVDRFNNVYITGSSNYNTPYYRFLTVKYDSVGNFIWSADYLNILFYNHYGKRVAVDSTNSVLVGGTSYGPESSSNDIVLIKYSQITSVQNISNQIPEEMRLFQNYPNPFNPETKINYELPNDVFVKIIIYDALGREVKILLDEFKVAGRYNVTFRGESLPSGVYYYRFSAKGEAGNFMLTKKMLLLK
ncbi:MAG: T9SS type A sorting domain-containing protein [Ignavibacteriae bacterium]|nr:T9SS type A sorting domain-containing protein [Ignavibacteriota bacterium]